MLSLPALHVAGQSCDVDFSGISVQTYSGACGLNASTNLTLGKNIPLGNNDKFTFDVTTNISGNLEINADGSGKIVIPAGVIVTFNGNVKLDQKNAGCTTSNPCSFEIEVHGTLIISGNLQNKLANLVWSGSGNISANGNFENDGCMQCKPGSCPTFNLNNNKCKDNQQCSGDFCTTIINQCATDTSKPVITDCPSNIIIGLSGSSCTRTVNWTAPVATDNCTLTTFTSTHHPGSMFPKGTTPVTYTATDAAGNTTTSSFTVTVEDKLVPIISNCPADITVNSPSNLPIVNWSAPTFSDNCPGTMLTVSKAPGSTFQEGTTRVVYTATDASGNTTSCSFNVTVIVGVPPIINGCPQDITLVSNTTCSLGVNWTLPTAAGTGVSLSSTHNPGDIFSIGTTTVTYTASANPGNVTICSFNVIVTSDAAPLISGCPEDMHLEANDRGFANATWTAPSASTACGTVVLTSSHEPGSFPVGNTVVEYNAIDEFGNTAICSFNVTVSQPSIKIGISRIVTPDGNGLNDYWELSNLEMYSNNKVIVFDRWGAVVFEGTGYNNQTVVWTGTNRNGTIVPTGTYFYSLVVTIGSAKFEETGFIEVIQ